eukprot:COSAG06_NODE_10781_length_1617_cov_16.277972_2_plen_429_part_00
MTPGTTAGDGYHLQQQQQQQQPQPQQPPGTNAYGAASYAAMNSNTSTAASSSSSSSSSSRLAVSPGSFAEQALQSFPLLPLATSGATTFTSHGERGGGVASRGVPHGSHAAQNTAEQVQLQQRRQMGMQQAQLQLQLQQMQQQMQMRQLQQRQMQQAQQVQRRVQLQQDAAAPNTTRATTPDDVKTEPTARKSTHRQARLAAQHGDGDMRVLAQPAAVAARKRRKQQVKVLEVVGAASNSGGSGSKKKPRSGGGKQARGSKAAHKHGPGGKGAADDGKGEELICPMCLNGDADDPPPAAAAAEKTVTGSGGTEPKQRATRKMKRLRSENKMGFWWKKYGYDGPRYCQRCSELFRDHIIRQFSNSAGCTRACPCTDCSRVLSHMSLARPQIYAKMNKENGDTFDSHSRSLVKAAKKHERERIKAGLPVS